MVDGDTNRAEKVASNSSSMLDFRAILLQKYPESDSFKVQNYLDFLASVKTPEAGEYMESHHILPKAPSMFPELTNEPRNLINLSARDHYRSHYLLALALKDVLDVQIAFYLMSGKSHLKETILEKDIPLYEELYVASKRFVLGKHKQIRHPDGRVEFLPKSHPDVVSGKLKHFNKNLRTVRSVLTSEVLSMPKDDPRILSGEFVAINIGQVTVRDRGGQIFNVSKNDPRFTSGEFVHVNKDTVCVRDKDGKKFRVHKADPRLISLGELVPITRGVGSRKAGANKGTLCVVDPEGRKFRVKLSDPRYLSGQLLHITSYKKMQRDKENGF